MGPTRDRIHRCHSAQHSPRYSAPRPLPEAHSYNPPPAALAPVAQHKCLILLIYHRHNLLVIIRTNNYQLRGVRYVY